MKATHVFEPDLSSDLTLETSWKYKVTVLADRIARHVTRVAAEFGGLNLSQWRVLAAIGDQDGRTASQVVEITPMDKGIVSRAVATLVSRGLLDRKASDQDGRSSHLYMTPKGRETFDDISKALQSTGPNQHPNLTHASNKALLETLNALIDSYDAHLPKR